MANTPPFDPAKIQEALRLVPSLPPAEQREYLQLIDAAINDAELGKCREEFIPFVKRMWPQFIDGAHHKRIAKVFEQIARGESKRVCISLPPRHTKSEFASYLLPAWYLGQFPDRKIIQASHTGELAVNFGRKVRNLVGSPEYSEVFPDVQLRSDSKAAGRWNTNHGGDYYAVGVGGALAGHGAHLCIIDDPHSEQQAMSAAYDPSVFEKAYEWFKTGPRQRLQPGGAIVIVMTRWGQLDLVGSVLKRAAEVGMGDEWEVIEFPAILNVEDPQEQWRALWPAMWPIKELLKIKQDIDPVNWNAQYMQSPTGEEGAIIKRHWWKPWEGRELPEPHFRIQAWDTAGRKTQRSDYSVCTTWDVFMHNDRYNLICSNIFRDRVEYPELKAKAKELYRKQEPDAVIIEAKNAGDALFQELRRTLPVQSYTPSRGEDKIVRANAVADIFASGLVWQPPERLVPGIEDLVEEIAAFPSGTHDDMVDSTVLALLRFRQGNFITLDMDDEDDAFDPELRGNYYI